MGNCDTPYLRNRMSYKKFDRPRKLPGSWTTTWSKQYLSAVHPMTCSLLWASEWGAKICGACKRKWRLTDSDLCHCGETQTMLHIVESCPLTKLNGDLSRLHSADEDAVSGSPVMVHDMHRRRRSEVPVWPICNFRFWGKWPLKWKFSKLSSQIHRRDTELRFVAKFGENRPLWSCRKVVWITT